MSPTFALHNYSITRSSDTVSQPIYCCSLSTVSFSHVSCLRPGSYCPLLLVVPAYVLTPSNHSLYWNQSDVKVFCDFLCPFRTKPHVLNMQDRALHDLATTDIQVLLGPFLTIAMLGFPEHAILIQASRPSYMVHPKAESY